MSMIDLTLKKRSRLEKFLNVAFKKYNASIKRIIFFYEGVEF